MGENALEKILQMIEPPLEEFFQKNEWSIVEAAMILSGALYPLKKGITEEIKIEKTAILIDCLFGLYAEEYATPEESNRFGAEYNNPDYSTCLFYHGKIPKKAAIQQTVNLGFDIHPRVKQYMVEQKILPEPEEYSQIRGLYRKWANMKLWSLEEASLLLFEIDPEDRATHFRFLEHQTRAIKDKAAQCRKYLERDALIGDVPCIKGSEIFFKPKDVFKWAKKFNLTVPYLLLEEFEKIKSPRTLESSKNKRGCREQILEEFEKRANANNLLPTWEEEISHLIKFANSLGEKYSQGGMRNLVKKRAFFQKQNSPRAT